MRVCVSGRRVGFARRWHRERGRCSARRQYHALRIQLKSTKRNQSKHNQSITTNQSSHLLYYAAIVAGEDIKAGTELTYNCERYTYTHTHMHIYVCMLLRMQQDLCA